MLNYKIKINLYYYRIFYFEIQEGEKEMLNILPFVALFFSLIGCVAYLNREFEVSFVCWCISYPLAFYILYTLFG